MSRAPIPLGYRGPHDLGQQPDQVMSDLVAQNLIAEIVSLHERLCERLELEVVLAALGPADPASGRVTGSNGEEDRMLGHAAAIRQAEAERARALKNARQRLRRLVGYYQDVLHIRCTDPAHHHTTEARAG